jgi:uncharacterized protein YukE
MAQFTGMDIGEVRTLANSLRTSAGEIKNLVGRLSGQIDGTPWVGRDRDQFVGDWQGQHVSQLNNVVQALEAAAQRADANANDQEAASNA